MAKRGSVKRRKPRGKKPPPRCKALLICERTIVEAGTGKVSIIGIFDNFNLASFPGLGRPFFVFMQLAEGIGRYEFVVEVRDLQEDRIIGRAEGISIEFNDRMQRANVMLPVPPLVLKHAGTYELVILANDQHVERQKFTAAQVGGSDQ